jgi:hypothetical protein
MIGMAKKANFLIPGALEPPALFRLSVFPFSSVRFGFVSGGHSHPVSENPAIRLLGPVGGKLLELDLCAAMPDPRPDPSTLIP